MIPKRRKPEPLGVREAPQIRCAGHLKWVRGFNCCIDTPECFGRIEAHHMREGGNGGMGVQNDDTSAVPLCVVHHTKFHAMGVHTFQKRYGVDLHKIAAALMAKSPHRNKFT